MADISYIMTIVKVSLFSLILFLAFIYSIPIVIIPRFRHRYNIFILNACLAIIGTCAYFIVYFAMIYFDIGRLFASQWCIILFYAYNIASVQIPFAFVCYSVHRYCSIIYHTKAFFKTKRWAAICIASQWIAEFALSLPFILRNRPVSIVFNGLQGRTCTFISFCQC